jgi:hypothetical protein
MSFQFQLNRVFIVTDVVFVYWIGEIPNHVTEQPQPNPQVLASDDRRDFVKCDSNTLSELTN